MLFDTIVSLVAVAIVVLIFWKMPDDDDTWEDEAPAAEAAKPADAPPADAPKPAEAAARPAEAAAPAAEAAAPAAEAAKPAEAPPAAGGEAPKA